MTAAAAAAAARRRCPPPPPLKPVRLDVGQRSAKVCSTPLPGTPLPWASAGVWHTGPDRWVVAGVEEEEDEEDEEEEEEEEEDRQRSGSSAPVDQQSSFSLATCLRHIPLSSSTTTDSDGSPLSACLPVLPLRPSWPAAPLAASHECGPMQTISRTRAV